jgi:hypothetical protein
MKAPGGKKPVRSTEQNALAEALKATAIDLAKTRELWREHGTESFKLVLGGMKKSETQALGKKLDKDNNDIAKSLVAALRERVIDLASGRAEPVFKKSILKSKAMAAT